MTSIRSKSGMKTKLRKGDIFSTTCYIRLSGLGTKILNNNCKVKLDSNRKGVITKDGRPVNKIGGKWVYIVK